MLEKWERQPARVGMLLGFVAVPLGWWLQSALIKFVFYSDGPLAFVLYYSIWGAIPGAVLGAGISKSVSALRQENQKHAKRYLIRYGAVVLTLLLGRSAYAYWLFAHQLGSGNARLFNWPVPLWLAVSLGTLISDLPFQIALLMLFIGLLMRPRR